MVQSVTVVGVRPPYEGSGPGHGGERPPSEDYFLVAPLFVVRTHDRLVLLGEVVEEVRCCYLINH
jgi:hypothetical protein